MLSTPEWYPLTVGLNQWNSQVHTDGGQAIYNLVITGSLLTIIPIVLAFLFMQRYWQSGLTAGSVNSETPAPPHFESCWRVTPRHRTNHSPVGSPANPITTK